MATQSQPRKQGKNDATPAADEPLVAIRAVVNNELFERVVPRSKATTIVRMARQWGYILRVRTRWAGDTDMRETFAERAIGDLAKLDIELTHIQKFALVEHIEVQLYEWTPADAAPAGKVDREGIVDAAAEIPWEYLFSAATRQVGRFQSLLITRCFLNRSKLTPTRPRRVLFLESAPGRIDEKYGFDDEETRIGAAVNVKKGVVLEFAKTEPYTKLKRTIESSDWQAIHVTGVDTHQAAWLINDFYDAVAKVARREEVIDAKDRLKDGMIIRGDHDSELPVRYDELADLLLASKHPKDRVGPFPYVITLNLYYSGARTARELVRRGAYAALGFLDEIDDEFAERFFQAFYWAWCHDRKSIPAAFLNAWLEMDSDRMHGTAIVIWLGHSIVNAGKAKAPPKPIAAKSAAKKKRSGAR